MKGNIINDAVFAIGNDTAKLLNTLRETDKIFEEVHAIYNETAYINADLKLDNFDNSFFELKKQLKFLLSDMVEENLLKKSNENNGIVLI